MSTWSLLYLPAENTETGELLWPEKFSRANLDTMKRQMGTALYSCMFLGKPEGLAGEVFRSYWFRFATLKLSSGGFSLVLDDGSEIPQDRLIVYQGYDLAISAKETADYTVCCTLALDVVTMNLYVLDITKGHWSFAQTQEQMARLAAFWKPNIVGIENQAYQAAAVQEARRNLTFAVQEIRADRDKVTRSRLPASLAEAGKLYLVKGLWTDVFLNEVAAFPNGAHDDQVDALGIACTLARNYTPSGFFLWGE